MGQYEILPHTADVRLRVVGATLKDLFTVALQGMAQILKKDVCAAAPHVPLSEMRITGKDATELLINFLSEALTFSHEHKAVACNAEFREFNETQLVGCLFGTHVREFDEDVKAVTYHEAEVKKNKEGAHETVIIFDI